MPTTTDARKRLAEAAQEVGGDVVSDAAVEAGVAVAEAMNADAWIVVPHPNTGEPMQQQVPPSYLVEGILTAALPHLRKDWENEQARTR